MNYSAFGEKLAGESGILRLRDDLGRPLPEGVKPLMLGGGNPARVGGVERVYRREMERLMADGDRFEKPLAVMTPLRDASRSLRPSPRF
jgi:valine--pyruvate aminotransferase